MVELGVLFSVPPTIAQLWRGDGSGPGGTGSDAAGGSATAGGGVDGALVDLVHGELVARIYPPTASAAADASTRSGMTVAEMLAAQARREAGRGTPQAAETAAPTAPLSPLYGIVTCTRLLTPLLARLLERRPPAAGRRSRMAGAASADALADVLREWTVRDVMTVLAQHAVTAWVPKRAVQAAISRMQDCGLAVWTAIDRVAAES